MLNFLWNTLLVIVLTPVVCVIYFVQRLIAFCKFILRLCDWQEPEQVIVETPIEATLPSNYRRRFALALGDIVYRRHHINCNSDEIKTEIESHRRDPLFKALLNETGMHANGDLQSQSRQLLRQWLQAFSPEHAAFVHCCANDDDVRDAIALECVRVAFLVRCMVIFDLIDESRAWLVLFLNAQRAQDCFSDWAEFAYSYANGRAIWITHADQGGGTSQRARMEVEHYLGLTGSNWQTLPWNAMTIFDPHPTTPNSEL
jgi:hypothetical protein